MTTRPDLKELVEQYYAIAPACVEKLEASPFAKQKFNKLYTEYVLPSVEKIKAKDNEAALVLYMEGVKTAIMLAEQP